MKVYHAYHRRSRGVAIVVVLVLVVLLTAIVVAFFSRAILDRQIANSSMESGKAEVLAHGALDEIIGDLRQEIVAGSTIDAYPAGHLTFDGTTFYIPKPTSSTALSTIVPAPVPSASPGVSPSNPVNVIKRSVYQQSFFAGDNYGNYPASNSASNVNSSGSRNLDGAFVSGARWNKPALLDGAKLGAADQATATYGGYFAAPDWVIVTRGGPKAFASFQAPLKNRGDLTNMDFALGRYAYVIYDEGGLLDINHAGFPASLQNNPDFTARRGKLAQVDLGKFFSPFDIKTPYDLVGTFRNVKTGKSADAYRNYILQNTPSNPGFLQVVPGDPKIPEDPGDQTFLSRQDLLAFQKSFGDDLSPDVLQYLGTFSREKNAPTFTPDPNRPRVQPGKTTHPNPALASDPLRSLSIDPGNPNTFKADDNFNPSLLTTRNGSGSPVFTRRFPLNRLSMLTSSGPAAGATAADIKKYFGLVWDGSDTWIYTSPEGTGTTPAGVIKFLKNIPVGRQPDFFETLQAAICVGSLGRDSDGQQYYNASYEPGTSSIGRVEAQNVYNHVMQIGANIIDQADADSYPTVIKFGSEIIAGIEDLPYISRVFDNIYRTGKDGITVKAEYQFEVWNPHQQLSGGGAGPKALRIVGVSGSAVLNVNGQYSNPADAVGLAPVGFMLSGAAQYRSPTPLSPGMGLGEVTVPGNFVAYIYGNPSSTFALQYQAPNGNWREYQRLRQVLWQIKESFYSNGSYAEWFHQRVDPRTDRFGTSMNYLPGDTNFGASAPSGSTLRPDAGNGYRLGENTIWAYTSNSIFQFFGGYGSTTDAKNSYLGTIADNSSTSAGVTYRDPDGVQRPGDGGSRLGLDGQPLATGNFASRPVIINRPFRSVAELGYVFRDVPFKSLDFTTDSSGDLALLDAFCIEDSDVVAGHVNINTRQTSVLKTLLTGAATQEGNPQNDGVLTDIAAQVLASAITTRTADPTKGPLMDRTELVSKFGTSIVYGGSTDHIKTQREVTVRSLAEVANTRTWNLLIDVIAQSGRYGFSANDLASFTVEGERRYWLHIAIDRYTGEIVDKLLEPVNE